MDGDFSANGQLKDVAAKNRETLYYVCATQFGWDKKKVDSQPMDYLMSLLHSHMEMMKKDSSSALKSKLPRGMRKNF
tara:strand:+ start:84 stop:314 length:231 start_codon:yes stop_codon:yes gene_type:complete